MPKTESDAPHTLWTVADLALVGAISLVTLGITMWVPGLLPTPVRVVSGFVFVFLLPGYVVTAALYPAMYSPVSSDAAAPEMEATDEGPADANQPSESPEEDQTETERDEPNSQSVAVESETAHPITAVEGLVLTVGFSIAVVPLAVLLVHFSWLAIGPLTTLGAVATVTGIGAIVAAGRRTPLTQYAGPPIQQAVERAGNRLRPEPTIRSSAEVITLVLLLISAGIAGAALTDTRGGERYTELSLLTEDEETGNLTAGGYPTSLQVGELTEVVVSVGNNEGSETRYTVITQLQSVSTSGEERTVTRANTLEQFSLTVDDEAVGRQRVPITVTAVPDADRHRLVVLLYEGDPPSNPTVSNAYREVHIWISVSQ